MSKKKNLRYFWSPLTVFVFFMASLPLWGQIRVEGKVTLENETDGAIGVNIVIKGDNSSGTITDLDGNFTIDVRNEQAVLVFSYIGYQPVERPVGAQRLINVELPVNSSQLEEVIVTGYSSQKRSSISGSVATLASKDLAERPLLRVEQALQGQTAGVQVAQVSGSPGSPLTVRVRGIGTINNSDPLYIVDGIPVDGLDFLNPNDIESINVLKDASSAAIYGSRGANGVVLITTKGGKKKQEGKISYDAYVGLQRASRLLDLLNAAEYATLQNEAYIAAGKTPRPEFALPSALGNGTDWQEAIFETAPISSHQLTFTGGGESSASTFSANYFSQDGIVGGPKSNFQRATVRLNHTADLKPWLTLGSNIGFTWLKRNGLPENNQYNSPLIRAINMDPVTPVRKQDGTFAYSPYADTDIANPVNGIAQTFDTWVSNRLVGSVFSAVKLSKNLTWRSTFSVDATFAVQRGFRPRYDLSSIPSISEAPPAEKNLVNSVSVGNNTWKNLQWENVLTWDKQLDKDQHLSLIAGTTALQNRFDANGGANTNLPSNNVKDAFISNTIDPIASQSAYQYASESALMSVFGKVNYSWKEKYLVAATLRADGSSRFGKNNRYGYFPSASLGWVLSQEAFWSSESVDFFKLRASWGQNGNDRIGDYSFTTVVYNGQNYAFGDKELITNGSVALSAANPDLKWETSTQTNFGADVEMLNGQWTATADYYIKKTEDMLYAAPIPLVAGTAPPVQNVATAENKGLEFSLNYRKSMNEWRWSLGGNISFVQSRITGLGRGGEPILSGYVQSANAFAAKTDVGQAAGAFFGYVTDGIFQTQAEVEAHAFQNEATAPGDIRFADLDGNGIIDLNDRAYIGNPTPDFSYGWNGSLSWNGLECLVVFQGTEGNEIYNNTTRYDFAYVNRPSSALSRWTGPGTSNYEPRVNLNDANQNARISDRFVEDGSYLRLKTATLSYNLPQNLLKPARMEKAKVFLTAQNLLTWTKYSGLDPEIGNVGGSLEIGIDRGFYPQARTFMVGLSATF
ncbi:MAG: TonB-dependent receptor [Saprospiraceae bacterium]|jgi:TonB-linked SusC/RagA family outer membrane protein|nr:TonB-dependent receptor [Saprospiraceae bacterium]